MQSFRLASLFLISTLLISASPTPKKGLKRTNIGFMDALSATEEASVSTSVSESADDTRRSIGRRSRSNTNTRILEPIPEVDNESGSENVSDLEVREANKNGGNARNDSRDENDEIRAPEKASELQDSKRSHTTTASEASKLNSSSSSSPKAKTSNDIKKGPSEEDRLIDDKLTFLVGYYDLYEKYGCPNNRWKHFAFIAVLTIILSLLFYLMYSVSSDYLTPSLAHLSAICRMSPDMAGLTFLAFGNGAPDLFTAVLGAEDAPEMILGSSIGSGLFILTVVFGMVIMVAKDPVLPQSNSSMILSFPSPKGAASTVKIGRGTFWRNALMYAGCVAALATFVIRREVSFWQPLLLIICFFVYLVSSILAHYLMPRKKSARNSSEAETAASATATPGSLSEIGAKGGESEDIVNGGGSMCLLELERKRYNLQQLSLIGQFRFALAEISDWCRMGRLGRFFWLLTSPLRLALNLTILPLPDPTLLEENSDKLLAAWFLARFLIVLNPFGSVLLLGWVSGIGDELLKVLGRLGTFFAYCGLTWILVLLFHLGSSTISNPLARNDRNWRQGLPFWLATIYSFSCCIAWIYAVSNELVAALSSLGLILGVARSVMGCLVLAWGNSIGDLIADVALARNGAPQTAITAIFSGPVQNVLLTIGLSFLAAAAKAPQRTLKLAQLRADIQFSLALLSAVILVCLIVIPGYFKYRIPKKFGFALIIVYIAYVPFSIVLGIQRSGQV